MPTPNRNKETCQLVTFGHGYPGNTGIDPFFECIGGSSKSLIKLAHFQPPSETKSNEMVSSCNHRTKDHQTLLDNEYRADETQGKPPKIKLCSKWLRILYFGARMQLRTIF